MGYFLVKLSGHTASIAFIQIEAGAKTNKKQFICKWLTINADETMTQQKKSLEEAAPKIFWSHPICRKNLSTAIAMTAAKEES